MRIHFYSSSLILSGFLGAILLPGCSSDAGGDEKGDGSSGLDEDSMLDSESNGADSGGASSATSAAGGSSSTDVVGTGGASDTPAPVCVGEASYSVMFDVTWTEENFPTDYPVQGPNIETWDAAHLSPLVGASHGEAWFPWKNGETASDGTEEMAESGEASTMKDEIQTQIDAKMALNVIAGSGVGYPPGTDSATFDVNETYALATVASMLAPSPDWFAGAQGVSLCGADGWISEVTVDAVVFDAGTDDGSDGYAYGYQDTQPREAIAPIVDGLFAATNVVGTFTFTKN